jgi:hypothetical protein
MMSDSLARHGADSGVSDSDSSAGGAGVVYVGRRPCGCEKGRVGSDASSISGVAAFLKDGGTIQTLSPEDAARVPPACDTCAPVRQGVLL